MKRIRILIADDHGIVRKGLRLQLEQNGEFEVVGEATEGREAVRMAEELVPDIIIMDIAMPNLNGIQATSQVIKKNPQVGVIILSAGFRLFEDDSKTYQNQVQISEMRQNARSVMEMMSRDLIADSIEAAVQDSGVSISEIDWFVPHQANQRILDATARRLKVPLDRFISTIEDHGNTSAASVPLALDRAVRDGRIKSGDIVVLEAMGGGFTWGAAALRY